MYTYRAEITKVYDGDTITCDIDLGFGIVMRNQKIRLYGINTPEIRGSQRPEGLRSKEALESLLLAAERPYEVTLQTKRDKKGKFGRWLAVVIVDGVNINQALVESGHAEIYMA